MKIYQLINNHRLLFMIGSSIVVSAFAQVQIDSIGFVVYSNDEFLVADQSNAVISKIAMD